ncbi:MAG: 30S ribosomal protein S1 [Candidatus Omnitrophica bacterium]|nr:30S ribosomal protein S1 [Candidatus Omnitrophota bacterium]
MSVTKDDLDVDLEQKEFEDMDKVYEETLKSVKEGEIVKGTIVEIKSDTVLIDIGYKSEGFIPLSEFKNKEDLKAGDEIDVLLEKKEDDDGRIVLSMEKASRVLSWERILDQYQEGDMVKGKIVRKVKGGLMVDVGVEAFLPGSQIGLRPSRNLDQYVGQEYDFKIVKINKSRKNIVVSRREQLIAQKEKGREALVKDLEVGQMKKGVVKNITDFGAFVDLGGMDGLLHITDMSWGRVSHPSEVLAVGDTIEVKILSFDLNEGKISLGLKQKTTSPWEDIENKFPIGERVKGKVVNLLPYGAFIELEKGVEGLIHISEFSWTRHIEHPSQMLAMGDIIEAMVLNIDKDNQKISLSLKQIEPNPWLEIEKKYPAGTTVSGKIRNIADYGAFVEVAEGIDGLVHISDISWTRKINHPSEVLKKGQKVDTTVISVDAQNQKIALGIKQLINDPWEAITQKYVSGTALTGKITKITNFGIFVEIEKDVEGLVHISEADLPQGQVLTDCYKEGAQINCKVVKIDNAERRIALSSKGLQAEEIVPLKELEVNEPEKVEPETAEPETAEPETAEPEITETEKSEPEKAEQETIEPETSQEQASQPKKTGPEA